jgi:hypothetical protein
LRCLMVPVCCIVRLRSAERGKVTAIFVAVQHHISKNAT